MTFATDAAENLHGLAADGFREARDGDAVAGIRPEFVIEPEDHVQIARTLAFANSHSLAVIPRGGGTKIGWGNPPRRADIVLSTRRLDRVIEHAAGDMTATVQAGCTVAAFQEILAKNGQRLAVDPLWPDRATIGGILATNDSGALRLAFGPLRDSLIGITVVLPDGTIARSGGKVVKNVAGYDLPKLFIGSFGTLGVIVEATFRLYPLAHAARTLCFELPTIDRVDEALARLADCRPVTSAVQLHIEGNGAPRVLVDMEGLPEAIGGKIEQVISVMRECGIRQAETPADTRDIREKFFDSPDACVCKVSLLPSQWGQFLWAVHQIASPKGVSFRLVGQSVGVGLLQLTASEPQALALLVGMLRDYLSGTGSAPVVSNESRDFDELSRVASRPCHVGSLVILQMPEQMRGAIDSWGNAGDALPTMRRIKEQFDPKQILSPGRFVGGI